MTLFDEPKPWMLPVPAPERHQPGMRHLRLVVRGKPIQQGDLNWSPKSRRLYHANAAELKPWRAHIGDVAAMAMRAVPDSHYWHAFDGDLAVRFVFTFEPPKTVKRRSPNVPPDFDKLTRAVCDALTDAHVWVDDARVVEAAVLKVYAGRHPQALDTAGLIAHIWELADA